MLRQFISFFKEIWIHSTFLVLKLLFIMLCLKEQALNAKPKNFRGQVTFILHKYLVTSTRSSALTAQNTWSSGEDLHWGQRALTANLCLSRDGEGKEQLGMPLVPGNFTHGLKGIKTLFQ